MANITARESEVLALAWRCFKSDPQVNYTILAELAGLKNAASATTTYLNAKKKMLASGTSKLTAREHEILALAWKCFKSQPQVDYKKLAEVASLKNAASATTTFLNAKKKLLQTSESSSAKSASPNKRQSLPTTCNNSNSPEAADDESSSPNKKRKRASATAESSPKTTAVLDALESEDELEAEQGEVKPKKRAKKGKKARCETGQSEPDEIGDEVDASLFKTAANFPKQEDEDGE